MSRSLARSRLAALVALPIAALLSACTTTDPIATELPPEARIDTTHFAPSLGINLSEFTVTPTGLYYKDLVVGTSDSVASNGDALLVHYIGWLPNGTVFDQTSPDQPPFGTNPAFILGAGSVIKGWDEGIVGMRVGGRRMLIVPPSLGYGYQATGRIPSNSVLVFRVDLYQANGKAPTTTGS
jgi:FKBP-type peptidyl-prolyl cis-trans isomerase FkpA